MITEKDVGKNVIFDDVINYGSLEFKLCHCRILSVDPKKIRGIELQILDPIYVSFDSISDVDEESEEDLKETVDIYRRFIRKLVDKDKKILK